MLIKRSGKVITNARSDVTLTSFAINRRPRQHAPGGKSTKRDTTGLISVYSET